MHYITSISKKQAGWFGVTIFDFSSGTHSLGQQTLEYPHLTGITLGVHAVLSGV